MLRRQAWALPIYVVGAVASAAALWIWSTPWIEGKAFATAAPAIPFAAVVAAGLLLARGRIVEGAVLGAVVAGAVLWSNVLQYHDVWLGPREQLAELSDIGERFAGEGPALQTEYQPYGVRHFLRKLDAEGASELRVRPVLLRDGRQLDKGGYANLDEFADADIRVYRTLVLRRSPTESRPASDYRLAWGGDWYDVWQRPEAAASPVAEHLPLGDGLQPGAVPDCAEVERLAAVAGDGGQLAAVVRPPVLSANVARATGRAETLEASVDVPRPGRYGIWLGGSFRDGLEARVDGRVVGRHRHLLSNEGGYTLLGEAELEAGTHTVMLRFSGPDLHPGSGGVAFGIGPLVLATTTAADAPLTLVPAERARELCGKRLDWIEALKPRGEPGPSARGVTVLSIRLTARRSRRRRRCRRRCRHPLANHPVGTSPVSATSVVESPSVGADTNTEPVVKSVVLVPPPRARAVPGQSTPAVSPPSAPTPTCTVTAAMLPLGPLGPLGPLRRCRPGRSGRSALSGHPGRSGLRGRWDRKNRSRR